VKQVSDRSPAWDMHFFSTAELYDASDQVFALPKISSAMLDQADSKRKEVLDPDYATTQTALIPDVVGIVLLHQNAI